MRPPTRTCVRSQASAGRPSARICFTYSPIGVGG
jgi:hypothetical protein